MKLNSLIIRVVTDLLSTSKTDLDTVTTDDVHNAIVSALEAKVLPTITRHVLVRLDCVGVDVVEVTGDQSC